MIQIQELKRELGEKYQFCRFLSDKEIRQIQKSNPLEFEPQIVASLTVGCVKMECCLYKAEADLQLGYDVFVKDDPDAAEWIFYHSPNVSASTKEAKMLAVLDQVIKQNGLSYTKCCFEKLEGKIIKAEKKAKKNFL